MAKIDEVIRPDGGAGRAPGVGQGGAGYGHRLGSGQPHRDLICARCVSYGVTYIDPVSLAPFSGHARAVRTRHHGQLSFYIILLQSILIGPGFFVLYFFYYSILIDLGHAPYSLYGVKYIDLISLAPSRPASRTCTTAAPSPRSMNFGHDIDDVAQI